MVEQTTLTLIGEKQAKLDYEFLYIGPIGECRDCRLKTVCFNLQPSRKYRIIEVRQMHHNCRIHEGGVRVVKVAQVPIKAAVSPKNLVEGSTINYEFINCANLSCENYKLCKPVEMGSGADLKATPRIKIIKIEKELTCPDRKKLVEITAEIESKSQ
jgi:hypothetical protein